MTLAQAADLYLKFVHRGEQPKTNADLIALFSANKALKDAKINVMNEAKLKQLVRKGDR